MEENKKAKILEELERKIGESIYRLKDEFDSNSNSMQGPKDYGHISTKIVMLQDVLQTIRFLEEEIE